jgi:hypothetical protein
MSALSARRGTTLAELVVAFTLLSVISALAAAVLVGAERRLRAVSEASGAAHTVRDGAALLAGEIGGGDSIVVRGDTAVELLALIGQSALCARAAAWLVLPPSVTSAGQAFTLWRSPPSAGDVAAAFDTSANQWRYRRVDAVSAPTDGGGCVPASYLITVADSAARTPVTRLVLADSFPPTVGVGAPVRLLRRVRWTLYRGGDGQWALGQRSCDPVTGCGTAQPAAGPFASARDSGLVIRIENDALTVRLRAQVGDGSSTDRTLRLPLRNRAR